MNFLRLILAVLFISSTTISCKDDAKKTEAESTLETAEATDSINEVKVVEKEKERQKVRVESAMGKLMVTPEAKSYMSYSLTCGIIDTFASEGPVTLFVPTNEAFSSLPDLVRNSFLDPKNKATLTAVLENHVVRADLSSADLLQAVKKDKMHTLKTIGGATLTVYMEGDDLMVKDANGTTATFGKTDILANNGKVHLINSVLTMAK